MRKWSKINLLPRLIVQCAAVSEIGRKFCVAAYAAEDESPIVFTVYLIFDELDEFCRDPSSIFGNGSRTRKQCAEASALVAPKWEALKHDSCMFENNGHFLKEDLDKSEKELAALEDDEDAGTLAVENKKKKIEDKKTEIADNCAKLNETPARYLIFSTSRPTLRLKHSKGCQRPSIF